MDHRRTRLRMMSCRVVLGRCAMLMTAIRTARMRWRSTGVVRSRGWLLGLRASKVQRRKRYLDTAEAGQSSVV